MPLRWINKLQNNRKISRFTPLTAFVHVPKTAGSTVNHYLNQSGKTGQVHCEGLFKNPDQIAAKLAECHWVSGHVKYPMMRSTLTEYSRRKVKYYTAIRSPHKHVMSHFNWLIEIYHKGGRFYDNHPPRAKKISERIRASDTSDPKVVVELLDSARTLFMNCQTSLVLGPENEGISQDELGQRLGVYEMVGTEETLPTLIEQISGLEYQDSQRKNVSPYHFPIEVFEDEFVVNYILENNAADIALYNYVKSCEK